MSNKLEATVEEIIYYQLLEMEQRLSGKAEAIEKAVKKLEELIQKIEAMN